MDHMDAHRTLGTMECLRVQGGGDIGKLVGPFSNVIEGIVKDKFVRNWLDLLSFLLSGKLPPSGHPPVIHRAQRLPKPRTLSSTAQHAYSGSQGRSHPALLRRVGF
jgi:hypothetical protein